MQTYPRSGFRSGGTSAKTALLENHLFVQESVNGGFQMVVRILPGEQIALPTTNLNLTLFLPQLYLILTSFYLF